jgi:RimJ/RimL family protein N-acetyltransferase
MIYDGKLTKKGIATLIKLELFTEADADRLISWVNSPDFLLQWAGPSFTFPLDRKQIIKHLEVMKGRYPKSFIYKAIDSETNEVIGHIELSNIDLENLSASISRVLVSPLYRGKGYGQEMIKSVLEIGFKEFQLHRIDLRVFDFNKGAIKCYEKCGFKKEGLLRDARKSSNGYWSLYQMSILENEWQYLA